MAEKHLTTEKPDQKEIARRWYEASQQVIPKLRSIRAIGDLLAFFHDPDNMSREDTLPDVGDQLVDLATESLVLLGSENPRTEPKSPADPEGGA